MGLEVIFGPNPPLALRMAFAFFAVLALVGLVVLLLWRFGPARSVGGLRRSGAARLGVIEIAAIDTQRRLVIVRRDSIEHLVMIGGPNDVLIESGIVRAQPATVREDRGQTSVPRPAVEPARAEPRPSSSTADLPQPALPAVAPPVRPVAKVEPPPPQPAVRPAPAEPAIAKPAPPPPREPPPVAVVAPRSAPMPVPAQPALPVAAATAARAAPQVVPPPRIVEASAPSPGPALRPGIDAAGAPAPARSPAPAPAPARPPTAREALDAELQAILGKMQPPTKT
jgi:flagellar protein FliO/FliZ